ncbi:SDR family oxidoreductase [Lacticaseibacillus saniviri]
MMTSTQTKQLVVVTGASSGIGKATAIKLATMGYHVIAGVLSMTEAEQLQGENIEPFVLDITDDQQIALLVQRIRQDPDQRLLQVLINNAGVELNAPFELLPLQEWRRQFDVNLFGQVALTQQLLPLLRESRGRIINITSVGGKVALPNYAAYAASKFAFEAASDALRREVARQGIDVVVVEPGGVQTEMAAYSGDLSLAFAEQMSSDQKALYGAMISKAVCSQTAFLKHALSASKAGATIAKIATKARVKARYSLGMDAKMTLPMAHLLPTRMMDLALR